MSTLEERVTRLEEIVGQGTAAGQYTAVIEKLMADYGWTAEEATENFNNLLKSLAEGGGGGIGE